MPINNQPKTCQIRLKHPAGNLPAGAITTANIKTQGAIVTATIEHEGSALELKQVAGTVSNFELIGRAA